MVVALLRGWLDCQRPDWQFVAEQSIPVGGGQYIQSWAATAQEGASIMAAYIAIFFAFTVVLYQRKESRG